MDVAYDVTHTIHVRNPNQMTMFSYNVSILIISAVVTLKTDYNY